MKMLIKSNKGCSNIPPLQNIIQDEGREEIVYGDDEKCELLNKYFNFISSLGDANVPLPNIEHKTNHFLRDIVITTGTRTPDPSFSSFGVYYYNLYLV
jgi:hypothetical protein